MVTSAIFSCNCNAISAQIRAISNLASLAYHAVHCSLRNCLALTENFADMTKSLDSIVTVLSITVGLFRGKPEEGSEAAPWPK